MRLEQEEDLDSSIRMHSIQRIKSVKYNNHSQQQEGEGEGEEERTPIRAEHCASNDPIY